MTSPLVRFRILIIAVFVTLALGSRQVTYSLPPAWLVVILNFFIAATVVWIGHRTRLSGVVTQNSGWDRLSIGLCILAIVTCLRGLFTIPSSSNSAIIGFVPSTREAVICSAVVWYYAGRKFGELSLHNVGPACLVVYTALYASGVLVEDVTIAAFHVAIFACLTLSESRRIALLGMLVSIGLMIEWQVWGGALTLCLAMAWRIKNELPLITQSAQTKIVMLLGFVSMLVLIVAFIPANGYESRIRLWSDAIADFSAQPWFGSGIGRLYIPESSAGFTHNTPLTILVEMGIIGIIPFIVILQGLRDHWSRYPTWLQSMTICLSAWSLIDEPFQWLGPACIVAFFLGAYNYSRQS